MAQVLLAVPALDVAPSDIDGLHVLGGQPERSADGLELLRRQQRVAALQRAGDKEGAGRRDLGERAIVHEHQFREHLRAGADFVVRERPGRVLLVGSLVIVERPVVEGLALSAHELVALHDVVECVFLTEHAEVGETTLRNGGRAVAERRVVGERAGTVVPVALPDRLDVAIRGIGRGIAAPAVEVAAEDEGQIGRVPVRDAALGDRVPRRFDDPLPAAGVVVVPVLAELVIDAQALEIVLEPKIHDPRHRVRAVHGRRAAGQHLYAFDQGARDLVHVGAPALQRRPDRQPPAVDQHQRAQRAEVAQVQVGGTGGAVGLAGVLTREDLRQRAHHVLDAHRALEQQFLGVHLRDRARTDQMRAVQVRAGDDDLLDLVMPGVLCMFRGRTGSRRERSDDVPPCMGLLHGMGLQCAGPRGLPKGPPNRL